MYQAASSQLAMPTIRVWFGFRRWTGGWTFMNWAAQASGGGPGCQPAAAVLGPCGGIRRRHADGRVRCFATASARRWVGAWW